MAELRFASDDLLFEGGELTFSDACCCEPCTIVWTEFTDRGCIAGGQAGALRTYADPGAVSASPWSIVNAPDGLRFDFEDSADDERRNTSTSDPPLAGGGHGDVGVGCASYNHFRQTGTATGSFTLAADGFVSITWAGQAEQEDDYFELMEVSIDGTTVASATSPGGGLGCAAAAPVISYPPSPVIIPLAAGAHTLDIAIDSGDSWFHVDAYYQFELRCGVTGPECCQDLTGRPTAAFDATALGACLFEFSSTSTLGTCGTEIVDCEWTFEVTGSPEGDFTFVRSGCLVSISFGDCTNYAGGRFDCLDVERPNCGDLTIMATLTVTDDAGCTDSVTQEVTCSNEDCLVTGTLNIETIGPCEYRLCAVVDWELTTCENPFLEIEIPRTGCPAPLEGDYDCTCEQLADNGELYCRCGVLSLADGECFNYFPPATVEIRYRWWTGPCGCPGPWSTPIELTCTYCECCDGEISGAIITINGIVACDPPPENGCDCDAFNGEYDVPRTEDCSGNYSFTIICPETETTFFLTWTMYCDEIGYWVSVSQSIGGIPGSSEDFFIGPDMPVCTDIVNVCGPSFSSGPFCTTCDNRTIQICITFYA